jgi:DNA-binding Lrp family transcriptional regulator
MAKIKIPANQERLLGEIDLRSDLTRESLAKTLRMKVPTVHYAVNALMDRKILMRRARIDFFKLGLLDVAVFFSVSESARGARRSLEKALTNDERTGWVSRLAGEYQYAVILLVRSLHDVSGFITYLKGF